MLKDSNILIVRISSSKKQSAGVIPALKNNYFTLIKVAEHGGTVSFPLSKAAGAL